MPDKKLVIPLKRYKSDTSVISARLPVDMIEKIDKVAHSTRRNRNEIIMLCLEFAIDNLEMPEDKNESEEPL